MSKIQGKGMTFKKTIEYKIKIKHSEKKLESKTGFLNYKRNFPLVRAFKENDYNMDTDIKISRKETHDST
jgi:hypothetical protein